MKREMLHLDTKSIVELRDMIGEDDFPEVFSELIESYLSESPDLVEGLVAGTENKDIELIKINAHSLKSSSSTLGATEFSQLCKKIEYCCNDKELEKASSFVPQFLEEYKQVELLMNQELKRLNK